MFPFAGLVHLSDEIERLERLALVDPLDGVAGVNEDVIADRGALEEIETSFYTGLKVTRDPGVPVVGAGAFLLVAGFLLTFFSSHRQVFVRLDGRLACRVAGFNIGLTGAGRCLIKVNIR